MINSRDKGARFERYVSGFLRDRGIEAQRGQQKAGGVDSQDVKHAIHGLLIECKHVERLNIWDAMAQAIRDAAGKLTPSVWFKRNRQPMPWVAVPADYFVDLLKKAGMV